MENKCYETPSRSNPGTRNQSREAEPSRVMKRLNFLPRSFTVDSSLFYEQSGSYGHNLASEAHVTTALATLARRNCRSDQKRFLFWGLTCRPS